MLHRFRHPAVLGVVFTALTLVYLYPSWLQARTALPDVFDARLNAWILAWDAHAFLQPPLQIFNANIFHPHATTLAFSENLIGTAVTVAPLNWIGEPILAANVALLLAFCLTGVAMALWMERLTASRTAAVVAAVAWTFAPARAEHLQHLQLLHAQWGLFALLAIDRYAASRRTRWLLGAALLLAWQYNAGLQLTLLLLPLVALYACIRMLLPVPGDAPPPPRSRAATSLAVAAALFIVGTAPVSIPYLKASAAEGFERNLWETVPTSARPTSLLSPSGINRAPHLRALADRFWEPEKNAFPGFVVAMLALYGVLSAARALRRTTPRQPTAGARALVFRLARAGAWLGAALYGVSLALAAWAGNAAWARSTLQSLAALAPSTLLACSLVVALLTWRPGEDLPAQSRWALVFAGIAVICYLLATGPWPSAWGAPLGNGPFALLFDLAFPYRSLRAVGRFVIPFTLAIVVVAANGYAEVERRVAARSKPGWRWRQRLLAAACCTALMLELAIWTPTSVATPGDVELYQALAALDGHGAVLHVPAVPLGDPPATTEYMLGSTVHWKPLINGFSGFVPSEFGRLAAVEPLSPVFYRLVRREFDPRWLVVHPRLLGRKPDTVAEQIRRDAPQLRWIGRFGDALLYEWQDQPERAARVYRRFSADHFRPTGTLEFLMRSGGRDSVDVELLTRSGVAERWTATRRRAAHRIELSAADDGDADGSLRLVWRTVPAAAAAVEIGSTGVRVLADLRVDVRASITLAVDGYEIDIDRRTRVVLATFTADGRHVTAVGTYEADESGLRQLRDGLASATPGTPVALAAMGSEWSPLRSAALVDAFRFVGVDMLPGDTVLRAAAIGVVGAPSGSALYDSGADRATARITLAPDALPEILIEDIRHPGAPQPR